MASMSALIDVAKEFFGGALESLVVVLLFAVGDRFTHVTAPWSAKPLKKVLKAPVLWIVVAFFLPSFSKEKLLCRYRFCLCHPSLSLKLVSAPADARAVVSICLEITLSLLAVRCLIRERQLMDTAVMNGRATRALGCASGHGASETLKISLHDLLPAAPAPDDL